MAYYDGPLGQREPTDKRHVELYPMRRQMLLPEPRPIVVGIDWHTAFDRYVEKWHGLRREYFIGLDPNNLGPIRGGHAVCVKPQSLTDPLPWWRFYDQGREGACVGFAVCRALSLVNRERYDGVELYRQAQRQDEWPGEDYSGTSLRAGLDVARERGPIQLRGGRATGPSIADSFIENRWLLSLTDANAALMSPAYERRGIKAILNSWGDRYPHIVYMPDETFDLVTFRRGTGESAYIIDHPR
jgi:hypothetical protein